MSLPLSRTSTLQRDRSVFTGVPVKAGVFSDADFTNPADGDIGVNTATPALEFRAGGQWRKVPVFLGNFASVSASGALTVSRQNTVDATVMSLVMTLPTGQPVGSWVEVEKKDTSANTVTISGNIRGAPGSSVVLTLPSESVLFVVDQSGSWVPFADQRTLASLDSRYLGTASLGGTANGAAAQILLTGTSAAPAKDGVVFKRADSTWGASQPYGQGQAFQVLSPSTQLTSDVTGDYSGVAGENPVMYRVDPYGGIGTIQGQHIAPGLRDTYGGGQPIGLWVQLGGGSADVPGVIVTMGGSGYHAPGLLIEDAAGTNRFVTGDSTGLLTYSTGTTTAAGIFAGTGGVAGARSIFNAISASVIPVWANGAVGQTAPLLQASVNGVIKSAIDYAGDFLAFADDGTTPLGGVYAGTTPAFGARSILVAGSPATAATILKAAAVQTAMLQRNLNSAATLLSGFDAAGDLITYATDGITPAAGVFAGDTPTASTQARAQFNAIAPALSALGLKAAASQTAPLQRNYNSAATVLSGFAADASLYVNADDGSTALAAVYTGTTPSSGLRAVLQAGAATIIPLRLQGAASQTANLLGARNSAGTLISGLAADGSLFTNADDGSTLVAGVYTGTTPSSGVRAKLFAGAATITPLVLQGATSQSANLLVAKNSAGTQRAAIDNTGNVLTYADNGTTGLAALYAGTTAPFGFRAFINTGAAASIGLLTQAVASQTADLAQFWNSSNAVLSAVNAGGTLVSRTAAGGIVLKDTQATPHYWRVTVSNTGVLTTTDIGTTVPTT